MQVIWGWRYCWYTWREDMKWSYNHTALQHVTLHFRMGFVDLVEMAVSTMAVPCHLILSHCTSFEDQVPVVLNYIDGSVQERHNSSALAMELCFSCTKSLTHEMMSYTNCRDFSYTSYIDVNIKWDLSQFGEFTFSQRFNAAMTKYGVTRPQLSQSLPQQVWPWPIITISWVITS